MANDRRNPYVILGVPFGATAEEARTGFAKATRRLLDETDVLYSVEDLTWALHQVEQIIEDPSMALQVYRIPADSNAVSRDQPGVFNPAAQEIQRQTRAATDDEWKSFRRGAASMLLREAISDAPLTLDIPRPYKPKEPIDGEKL